MKYPHWYRVDAATIMAADEPLPGLAPATKADAVKLVGKRTILIADCNLGEVWKMNRNRKRKGERQAAKVAHRVYFTNHGGNPKFALAYRSARPGEIVP